MRLITLYLALPTWLKLLLAALSLGIFPLISRNAKGQFVAGGGTDEYPQWLNLTGGSANGTTYATFKTNAPVLDNEVMEILAVQWKPQLPTLADVGAGSGDQDFKVSLQLTPKAETGIVTLDKVLDLAEQELQDKFAETTETGGAGYSLPDTSILHDFATSGHGFLYGGREIHLGIDGSDANITQFQQARILYRSVKVSSTDLLGMIRALQ